MIAEILCRPLRIEYGVLSGEEESRGMIICRIGYSCMENQISDAEGDFMTDGMREEDRTSKDLNVLFEPENVGAPVKVSLK